MGSQREKKDHRNKASPQKSEMSVCYERINLDLPLLFYGRRVNKAMFDGIFFRLIACSSLVHFSSAVSLSLDK